MNKNTNGGGIKNKIILSLFLSVSLFANDGFDFDSVEIETVTEFELKNDILKDKKEESTGVKEFTKENFISEENLIEEDNNEIIIQEAKSSFGSSEEVDAPILDFNQEEIKEKEPLKKYTDISYVKGYEWFSILEPNEDFFSSELFKRNWTEEQFQNILNERTDSSDHIFMSAIYYDYVKKDPSMAENFYLKFRDHFAKNRHFKLYLSDYLIRTGRYKNMHNAIITKTDIFSYLGCKGNYYMYYKGVLTYLNTKNKNNFYIRKAADCKISKAKEFLQ